LDALKPKLDRYFTELPRIEQDEALYNGQITSITERFNALSSCEFPQPNVHNNNIIVLHDDLLAAVDRRDYITAMELAAKVDEALKAHNDAEDLLEQESVAEKSKYDERMSGLDRRYTKAKDTKSDDFEMALILRIQELPTRHGKVTGLASDGEYVKAYELGKDLHTEIDEILELITAAELAAAVSLAEESSDKDLWDYIEEEGLEIAKSVGKKLMDKAFDKVGGKIDDIYDFGDSLYSLGGSIKDMDIDGIMTNGLATLKNGTKLHPAVMAYENAIDIASTGYGAYKLGKKAWGIIL